MADVTLGAVIGKWRDAAHFQAPMKIEELPDGTWIMHIHTRSGAIGLRFSTEEETRILRQIVKP